MQTYERKDGESLTIAMQEMAELAIKSGEPVSMDLGCFILRLYQKYPSLHEEFEELHGEINENNLQSQKHLDEAMLKLPNLDFKNLEALIYWLCEIQDDTDNMYVKTPREEIISVFHQHGYEPGVNVGKNCDIENKESFARYMIGQALECLQWYSFRLIHRSFLGHAKIWREKFCKP